jgi:hypothetical protein
MDENVSLAKHNLLFGVRRSIRYHTRRRMFFDSLYKWSQVLALLSGSATVATAISKYADGALIIWFAAAVAVFSAVNLVFGFAQSARLHSDFVQKFSELEKRIIMDLDPSMASINAFTVERLNIEAVEPPILRILDLICHNELCRAMGMGEERMAKINFFQRLFAQFFDLMDHKIQAPKPC